MKPKAICSECGVVVREGPEPASHTWCPDCAAKVLETIENYKEESKNGELRKIVDRS